MRKQDLKQSPSSPAASPASPSPPRESGGALRMTLPVAGNVQSYYRAAAPLGAWGKCAGFINMGSTKRFLTWQKRIRCSPIRISACGVGAWHERQRTFIVAADVPTPLASDKSTCRDAANLDVFLSDNGIFRKRNKDGTIWSLSLSAAVFYLTPAASEGYRSTLKPTAFRGKSPSSNLSAQVIHQEQPCRRRRR